MKNEKVRRFLCELLLKKLSKLAEPPSTVTRVVRTNPASATSQSPKLMKELNYHPNSMHVVLKAVPHTSHWCCLLPDDSDAFTLKTIFPSAFAVWIAQVASEFHYAIQIATGKWIKERMEAFPNVLGKRVNGLIFLFSEMIH